VSGAVTLIRSCPGDLFPVNSIGERHVPSLFSRNRRVAIVLDTEPYGRVTVVMVGAIIVGRISITALGGPDVALGNHLVQPPQIVQRGDEIGVFHLGSTAIVFLEPGHVGPFARPLGPVRLGQSLMGDP
jgi:phosphatidylserine decarboxylase